MNELLVLSGTGEVPIPTQQQVLIDRRFDVSVGGFNVAVLLRFTDIDAVPLESVVAEQRLILLGEFFLCGEVVDGSRKTIASHSLRDSTGKVQCVL